MTSLVGIRCTDGVVIAADGSATFGPHSGARTIEQPFEHKITLVDGHVIVAGTGQVGHGQRFTAVVTKLWQDKAFRGKSGLEVGKLLSGHGINDFGQTIPPAHLKQIDYAALVAYPAADKPWLCELLGWTGFQPEIKEESALWFTSTGSGQPITDPFLALLRSIFWREGPPNLQGGIFTALWALQHACEINPGGIKEPIKLAVLAREKGKLVARMLSEEELHEHGNMIGEAKKHIESYPSILLGEAGATSVPKPNERPKG